MNFNATLRKLGIEHTVNYLYRDPEKNLRVLAGEAAADGGGERGPLHRSHVPGERGAPVRQMRPVRRPVEACSG